MTGLIKTMLANFSRADYGPVWLIAIIGIPVIQFAIVSLIIGLDIRNDKWYRIKDTFVIAIWMGVFVFAASFLINSLIIIQITDNPLVPIIVVLIPQIVSGLYCAKANFDK